MKPLRKHLTREEVNDEKGDMEMGAAVADQHTDGNRNHDGRNLVYGVKKVGTDRKSVGPLLYLCYHCSITGGSSSSSGTVAEACSSCGRAFIW